MSQTPEEIEADIELQRQQLAATVDQLAAKLDVKSRAADQVAALRAKVTTPEGRPTVPVLAAAVLSAVLVVGLVVWRRRS